MLHLAFKYGVRLDLKRRMHDVAFDVSTGFKLHLAGADRTLDASFDANNFGLHFTGNVATGTDGDVSSGYVSVHRAVDLQCALGRYRSIDLHVCTDDRCGASGWLGGRSANGILSRSNFRLFNWSGGVTGFVILREHGGLLSKTLLDHMLYR